jgi:hypothetical protein
MVRRWLRPSEHDGHRRGLKLAMKMTIFPLSLALAHPPMYMNLVQFFRSLLPIIVPLQKLIKHMNQSRLHQMFGILCDHWILENV